MVHTTMYTLTQLYVIMAIGCCTNTVALDSITFTVHRQSIVFDTTLPVFRKFTVALSSVSPKVK